MKAACRRPPNSSLDSEVKDDSGNSAVWEWLLDSLDIVQTSLIVLPTHAAEAVTVEAWLLTGRRHMATAGL